jgi:hypothetical protein
MPDRAMPGKSRILADYITRPQLALELNKTVLSLQRWERKHFGPHVTRVGDTPYYRIETVRAWLADQEKRGWPARPAKDPASSNGEV